MNYKYSATTDMIYPVSLLSSYKDLPTDLVDITDNDASIHMGNIELPEGKQRKRFCYPFEIEDIPPKSTDECRCTKLAELRAECEGKINAGFESDVLGYPCQYHNDRDQQQTMRDAAINGGKIWRNEEFTLHTKAQAEIVLAKSISEKEAHRTTYANKCSYINAPERTVDEINAVTWASVE